jgi:hypothetical protein
MKTNRILFFALLAAISFSACKDDDEPTVQQRLQGVWTFEKTIDHDVDGALDLRDTTYGVSGDYVDFRSDNKVYSRYAGLNYDTSNYSIVGSDKLVLDGDTLTIQSLTNNSAQFYSRVDSSATEYSESWIYLKK